MWVYLCAFERIRVFMCVSGSASVCVWESMCVHVSCKHKSVCVLMWVYVSLFVYLIAWMCF